MLYVISASFPSFPPFYCDILHLYNIMRAPLKTALVSWAPSINIIIIIIIIIIIVIAT